MAKPIDAAQSPLIRALLLHEADKSVLILASHHSIGDGLSLTFIVRDVLLSLSGQPIHQLRIAPSIDELLESAGEASSAAASEQDSNPPDPAEPTSYRVKDGALPQIRTSRLDSELTKALCERTRQEGTTIHGAFCAAVAPAAKQNWVDLRHKPIRLIMPIDLRKLLGLVDESVLSITVGPTIFPFFLLQRSETWLGI